MRFRHADKTLQRMDDEPVFDDGVSHGRIAGEGVPHTDGVHPGGEENENSLRAMKSYHFERLKGKRASDYSIRLNKQFRLICQIEPEEGGNRLVILAIEDYH